jgi:hypothetical protein
MATIGQINSSPQTASTSFVGSSAKDDNVNINLQLLDYARGSEFFLNSSGSLEYEHWTLKDNT